MSNDVTQRHCIDCGTILKDSEKHCPICRPDPPIKKSDLLSEPITHIGRGRPSKKPQDPKNKDPPKEPEIQNTNSPEKPQKPNSIFPPSPGPSSSPKPLQQHKVINLEQKAQIVKELILQNAFEIAKDFIDFIEANCNGTQD